MNIVDLKVKEDLDKEQMAEIRGGFGWGFTGGAYRFAFHRYSTFSNLDKKDEDTRTGTIQKI